MDFWGDLLGSPGITISGYPCKSLQICRNLQPGGRKGSQRGVDKKKLDPLQAMYYGAVRGCTESGVVRKQSGVVWKQSGFVRGSSGLYQFGAFRSPLHPCPALACSSFKNKNGKTKWFNFQKYSQIGNSNSQILPACFIWREPVVPDFFEPVKTWSSLFDLVHEKHHVMFVLGEEVISNFTSSWDFVIFKVRSPTVSNRFPLDTFGPSKKELRCAEMLM